MLFLKSRNIKKTVLLVVVISFIWYLYVKQNTSNSRSDGYYSSLSLQDRMQEVLAAREWLAQNSPNLAMDPYSPNRLFAGPQEQRNHYGNLNAAGWNSLNRDSLEYKVDEANAREGLMLREDNLLGNSNSAHGIGQGVKPINQDFVNNFGWNIKQEGFRVRGHVDNDAAGQFWREDPQPWKENVNVNPQAVDERVMAKTGNMNAANGNVLKFPNSHNLNPNSNFNDLPNSLLGNQVGNQTGNPLKQGTALKQEFNPPSKGHNPPSETSSPINGRPELEVKPTAAQQNFMSRYFAKLRDDNGDDVVGKSNVTKDGALPEIGRAVAANNDPHERQEQRDDAETKGRTWVQKDVIRNDPLVFNPDSLPQRGERRADNQVTIPVQMSESQELNSQEKKKSVKLEPGADDERLDDDDPRNVDSKANDQFPLATARAVPRQGRAVEGKTINEDLPKPEARSINTVHPYQPAMKVQLPPPDLESAPMVTRDSKNWKVEPCYDIVSLPEATLRTPLGAVHYYQPAPRASADLAKEHNNWFGDKWNNHGVRTLFERCLLPDKDLALVDIGAKLGPVAFTAATTGRKVIAIEPIDSNAQTLCRTVTDFNYTNVHVVHNAVADDRWKVYFKTTSEDKNEPNESYVVDLRNRSKIDPNAPSAYTIKLDDILRVFKITKAAIKMDVNGFEGRALAAATKFFNTVQIPCILMEWKHVRSEKEFGGSYVFDVLSRNGYFPHDVITLNTLKVFRMNTWPDDVIWAKIDSYVVKP